MWNVQTFISLDMWMCCLWNERIHCSKTGKFESFVLSSLDRTYAFSFLSPRRSQNACMEQCVLGPNFGLIGNSTRISSFSYLITKSEKKMQNKWYVENETTFSKVPHQITITLQSVTLMQDVCSPPSQKKKKRGRTNSTMLFIVENNSLPVVWCRTCLSTRFCFCCSSFETFFLVSSKFHFFQ